MVEHKKEVEGSNPYRIQDSNQEGSLVKADWFGREGRQASREQAKIISLRRLCTITGATRIVSNVAPPSVIV